MSVRLCFGKIHKPRFCLITKISLEIYFWESLEISSKIYSFLEANIGWKHCFQQIDESSAAKYNDSLRRFHENGGKLFWAPLYVIMFTFFHFESTTLPFQEKQSLVNTKFPFGSLCRHFFSNHSMWMGKSVYKVVSKDESLKTNLIFLSFCCLSSGEKGRMLI